MSARLARVAARLFNAPLLVAPETAIAIASNLADRFGVAPLIPAAAPASRPPSAFFDSEDDGETSPAAERKPYDLRAGVALIGVRGELVNRGSWLDAASGLTSYDGLRSALAAALGDAQVRAIALDIDSPGGEAAGAFETAAAIRAAAKDKRVVAHVNGMAASAAYALAAGADEIVASPTAMLGSIGVVWLHMDYSKSLAERGMKPTLLHAGAYKVDGSPVMPLDPEAAKRISATVGDYYRLFLDSVGGHRPGLGAEGARATEAGVYIGAKAVAAGLADRVGGLDEVVADLAAAPLRARRRGAALNAEDMRMTVHLHKAGEAHAAALIAEGKVDKDSAWSFSAEDGDKLLGANGDDWKAYAAFHLGEDSDAAEDTKARWKYPYGKDGKVYRHGVIAAKSRAAAEGQKDIEDAATRLLETIDGEADKKEARAATQAHGGPSRPRKGAPMSNQNEPAAVAGIAEADHVAALAAHADQARASERARVAAILDHAEAKGREPTARKLAFSTEMSVESAAAFLADLPRGQAAPALADRVPRVNLGAGGGEAPPPNDMQAGAEAATSVLQLVGRAKR